MHLPHFPRQMNCRDQIPNLQSQPVEHRFRDRLQDEFDTRRKANERYSLRAFAAFLGTDHSTLSQILRKQRAVPLSQIRKFAKKLKLDAEITSAYVAAEHLPDPQTAARESLLRHWTAEASAIIMQPVHWAIFRLSREKEFRNDSRWIAEQTNSTVDQVNIAFSRLLRLELLRTDPRGRWISGAKNIKSEREFQKTALVRVRQKAAEYKVKLPSTFRL